MHVRFHAFFSASICRMQCYTLPLNVKKDVFEALSKSGVPYATAKSSPAAYRTLSTVFPLLYICAIYFFVFKKG